MPKIKQLPLGQLGKSAYTIIKYATPLGSIRSTKYCLKANCCGKEVIKTHEQCNKIKNKSVECCHDCYFKIDAFEIGYTELNHKIVAIIENGGKAENIKYKIRKTCCGNETEIYHNRLVKIFYYQSVICKFCRQKAAIYTNSNNEIEYYLGWPLPKGSLEQWHKCNSK